MKIQERRRSREIFGKDEMFEGYGKSSFGVSHQPILRSLIASARKEGLETFQRGEGFLVADSVLALVPPVRILFRNPDKLLLQPARLI